VACERPGARVGSLRFTAAMTLSISERRRYKVAGKFRRISVHMP
jgi:hypothetical protein